jgi:hypothetical protein
VILALDGLQPDVGHEVLWVLRDCCSDEEAEAIRGYCLAVRSALTDDGRPPLDADGLRLKKRLQEISDSIARVEQKRGFPPNSAASIR